jgi:hypothetical protein
VVDPTIEDKARRILWAIKNFNMIADRISRFGVETLSVRKLGAESLTRRLVLDHRRPNPRASRLWISVDGSLEAYHGATLMDPEALDVETPQ